MEPFLQDEQKSNTMRSFIIALLVLAFTSCENKQKTEKVKEDIQQGFERMEEKVDENLQKVREKAKVIKDTLKSKIHRATAPDSQ